MQPSITHVRQKHCAAEHILITSSHATGCRGKAAELILINYTNYIIISDEVLAVEGPNQGKYLGHADGTQDSCCSVVKEQHLSQHEAAAVREKLDTGGEEGYAGGHVGDGTVRGLQVAEWRVGKSGETSVIDKLQTWASYRMAEAYHRHT